MRQCTLPWGRAVKEAIVWEAGQGGTLLRPAALDPDIGE